MLAIDYKKDYYMAKKPNKIQKDQIGRVTCELPESLRRAFNAKVKAQGKTIRDVLQAYIEQYVKNGMDN